MSKGSDFKKMVGENGAGGKIPITQAWEPGFRSSATTLEKKSQLWFFCTSIILVEGKDRFLEFSAQPTGGSLIGSVRDSVSRDKKE